MEMFNFEYDDVVELGSRSHGTTGKKRKWREIEALKDKHRLQKELLTNVALRVASSYRATSCQTPTRPTTAGEQPTRT